MSNKDYEVKTLTKIVTTIGEFQTELTCEEVETRVEEALANGTKLTIPSLITELTFGNRINTCKETIKLDLLHVHILGYKATYDISPKLNERETLEAIAEKDEKQEARLKVLQSKKDQWKRINDLDLTVAEMESDKKEKELQVSEMDLKEEIAELDEKLAK
jgi:hypothetical protein